MQTMTLTTTDPGEPSHAVRPRALLLAATALIVALLLGTSFAAITADRARVSDHSTQTARNLSLILREHAQRTFGELDRVLVNLASAVRMLTLEGTPEFADRALTHMTAGLSQAGAVAVTSPRGEIRTATAPVGATTAKAIAAMLSRAPLNDLTIQYLGMGTGARPGEPGPIAMARPIHGEQDQLLGWTVALLDQHYFDAFYQSIDIGPGGLIAIIHDKGPILFRSPPLHGAIGTDVSSRPLFTEHLAAAPAGTFHIRTGTDDVERVQAYAKVADVPLIVLVGVTTEHAFAAWTNRALWLGGLATVATLVVIGLATLLGRQFTVLQSNERRTRQVETHLSRAQAIAHVGSWEWNLATNAMWWSPELHRIYDQPEDGESPSYGRFLQAIHPDDRAAVASGVARALDDGQGFTLEYRVRRIDGTERHVRHEGQCVLDAQGTVVRMDSVVQDTTESTLLQAQLAQAGKLSTLGEMAAGMAHELSQPLNILRMAAEGALIRLEERRSKQTVAADDTLSRETLQQVSDQADRMAQIIDHIRIFSRKDTAPTQVFDARTPVSLAVAMMDNQLAGAGIRLDVDLPTSSAPVKGRPVQLEQVVVNLLANAKDSIMERRAQDRAADGSVAIGHVALTMRRLGSNIEIIIQDDGMGVPAGLFGRIFEPFFSTKGVGEGTGLGLSVSYGIVTGMGGTLAAGNRPGVGAAFEITLPLQVGSVVAERDRADTTDDHDPEMTGAAIHRLRPAAETGATHVLLVEDEPDALDAMREHVRGLGYRVSTASGGDIAWRRFVIDPADVVVTDLRMGSGDGECLIRRLREVDPFLPIVVVSGHLNAMEALQRGRQDPNTRILAKPLSLNTLGETVETLLRQSA